MLFNFSGRASSAEQVTSRDSDFDRIYKAVMAKLTEYTDRPEGQRGQWHDKALALQQTLEDNLTIMGTEKKPNPHYRSLIFLIEKTKNLSPDLHTYTDCAIKTLAKPLDLISFGLSKLSLGTVNIPPAADWTGSTLKKSLDNIVSGTDPYSALYIHNEIDIGRKQLALEASAYSAKGESGDSDSIINVDDVAILSYDSLRTLYHAKLNIDFRNKIRREWMGISRPVTGFESLYEKYIAASDPSNKRASITVKI